MADTLMHTPRVDAVLPMPRQPASPGRESHRRRRHWRERLAMAALWLVLSWGVLAFGAVYQWAYTPLLAVAAALGIYGWATGSHASRAAARPLGVVLLAAAALTAIQLVPLPTEWTARISPGLSTFLFEYDLSFALDRQAGRFVDRPLSISPGDTTRGLVFLLALGAFALGLTALLTRLRLTRLVRGIAALGLSVAVFGIVQKATYNRHIYWVWDPVSDPANAFGPFINRNHFAGWMLMATALSAGYLCALVADDGHRPGATRRQRVAWFVSRHMDRTLFMTTAVLTMTLSVVWTMSRSGIAGLATALLLLACLVLLRLKGGRRVALLGLLAGSLVFGLAWRGVDRVVEWYGRTGTLEWRIQLWKDAVPIIGDFQWVGTGLNTYGVATVVYPTSDPDWHPNEAHSDYVQILVEGGVVLAAITIAGMVAIALGIRRRFGEPQPVATYWVRAGAMAGLAGIAVQELTAFSLQMPGNAVLMGVLAAIALHHPGQLSTALVVPLAEHQVKPGTRRLALQQPSPLSDLPAGRPVAT